MTKNQNCDQNNGIQHSVFLMSNLFYLEETTAAQRSSNPMTNQGSTFGMYKHFLTLTFVLLLEILWWTPRKKEWNAMDIVTQNKVNFKSS